MLLLVPVWLLLLMLLRRPVVSNAGRRVAFPLLALGLLAPACAAPSQDQAVPLVTLANPEPVATTAPVGVPLVPTPTPLTVPPTLVPTPTPLTTPQPVVATPTTPPAEPTAVPPVAATAVPVVPDPTATAVPPTATPAPEPTAEPTPEPTAEPTPEPTSPPPPLERVVVDTNYQAFGRAADISLTLPVRRIEFIGFHEAGHPGSTAINAAWTGVETITLASRGRGTHARSAVDIVVPPGEVVVAPVTGTVVASGQYVLYCKYDDGLVYIEPDGLPGWQVRLFHVTGEGPAIGSRVEAGATVIATGAQQLPFESQVDEHTGEPSWPHVHIEVVDTSVPDTRPPGPGCD